MSMCIACDGAAYFANGIDTPQRWDGRTALSEDAGLVAPTSACDIAGSSTSGSIWGDYTIYTRFVDDAGIPSNFSSSTTISLTSGAAVTAFTYTNVPQPSDRAVRTEIWRNTRGQAVTWYRDVADAGATAYTTNTDGTLINQQSLRYLTAEGWPNAMRFTPPPDWASVVVDFQNRTWWGVPVEYDWGEITASTSTSYVKIPGAKLHQNFIGRNLYAAGLLGTSIASVDSNTALTLTAAPSAGAGTADDYYCIATSEANFNTVRFSEAGEPESCPDSNALVLQPDGDRLTAQMALGAYLYLFKEHHVYRLSTAGDPRRDAIAMQVSRRGCLNQRCWCRVEGAAFVMDERGAYLFDGNQPLDVSVQIADWFQKRVNWAGKRWFHLAHSPEEQTVRCCVAVDNDYWPQDVFAFNYQLGQWHHERYPYKLTASAQVPINGQERTLVGMEESVGLLNEGVLDGPSPGLGRHEDRLPSVSETTRGTLTAATATTLTDSAADFDFSGWSTAPQDVGAPVYVIDSNGDFQMRRIASVNSTSSTLTLQHAWSTTPTAGDTYQIGGIEVQGKWGSFALPEEHLEQVRRVLLRFQPQQQAGKINLRKYFDHTSAVQTAAIEYNDNVGVNVKRSSGNVQMDLTTDEGVLQHRFDDGFEISSPANRSVEVELKGVQGKQRTKIYELRLDGVER